MKSAGRELLAWMPPTSAAAITAASGFCAATQSSTSFWRVRSRVRRSAVRISQSIWRSRRTMAEPTMPRWPATQTRLPASGNRTFLGVAVITGLFLVNFLAIRLDHLADQILEAGLVLPAELRPRLRRITEQQLDFRGAEIPWIDLDQHLASFRIYTLLLDTVPAPGDAAACLGEGELDEFTDG